MMTVSVSSLEYGPLLSRELPKRLREAGAFYEREADRVILSADPCSAAAITALILSEVRPLELIRMAELLPKELREDGRVILRAEELSRSLRHAARIREEVLAYMERESVLIIEGFVRFRLQFLTDEWAVALDRAAEEIAFLRLF